MARRRDDESPTIGDRIAAFVMLDGMPDATQAQKTVRLEIVGFSTSEIARMLATTPAVVYQNLYDARRRAGGRKTRPKAAPARTPPDDQPDLESVMTEVDDE
jgi:DNA-directed RNA polymerase specialized sigma24 family protein